VEINLSHKFRTIKKVTVKLLLFLNTVKDIRDRNKETESKSVSLFLLKVQYLEFVCYFGRDIQLTSMYNVMKNLADVEKQWTPNNCYRP